MRLKSTLLVITIGLLASCSDGEITSNYSSSGAASSSPGAPILDAPSINPLKTKESSVSIFAGDSYRISITGGKKPYSLTDPQQGLLDKDTYYYSAPTTISPLTEILNIIDAIGTSISIAIKVKAFEPFFSAKSIVQNHFTTIGYINSVSLNDGSILVGLQVGSSTNGGKGVILKSTNNGSSFTESFETSNNGELNYFNKVPGGALVAVLKEDDRIQFKKSIDNGMSWIKVSDLNLAGSFQDLFIGGFSNNFYLTTQSFDIWDNRELNL